MPRSGWGKGLIILLLVLGAGVVGYGVRHLLEVLPCRSWPAASGLVRDASVRRLPGMAGVRDRPCYLPQVVYEYQVDGRCYWADGISPLKLHPVFGIGDELFAGEEQEVAAVVAQYPVDSRVAVRYNPLAPAEAVLDPSLRLPSLLPFLAGLLLVYCAGHLAVFGDVFVRWRTASVARDRQD